MSTVEVARLQATVDQILRRLDALQAPKKPGLTIVAFAKEAGIGKSTVSRLLAQGRLYRKNGKIPNELLSKFQS